MKEKKMTVKSRLLELLEQHKGETLSGEALAGERKNGVDAETLGKICDKIKEIVDMGVEVSIVVGGGNFWRGKYGLNMERTTSDYMGMLATAMNGLALQDSLEARGL